MYYLYILECANGTYYTGITTDVARRFDEHKRGVGARYTRSSGVHRVAYSEKHTNRSQAQKREAEVKRLSHSEKQALCAQ